jgi:hypothetical protein
MGIRSTFAGLALCLSFALTASPASAQATRTWVSGVGDDANPCSRTAPCKTFAGAISKTAPGGEINCLDPGGFGGVTITKALSIVCQYTEGGVLSAGAGVNGVVVNAGVNDNIYLRGIDFHGAGNAQNGVRFVAGGSLTIEDCVIRAYQASSGQGVSFQPTGTSRLVINNTTIAYNGTGATGGGILIQPTGAGVANAVLNHVRVTMNANAGVLVNGASTVMITNSVVSNNPSFGIRTASGSPTVRVGGTQISANGTGVSVGAGTIESYCTNQLNGNSGDGAFFGACLAQK